MRQNKILSGIEQSQKAANARAHYASGLVAPPVARALAQPAPRRPRAGAAIGRD
jgi:hypothetical protein